MTANDNLPQLGDTMILHIGDMDFPCTCTHVAEDGFRTIVTSTPCRDYFHAGGVGYLDVDTEEESNTIFLSWEYGVTCAYPARHADDVTMWMEKT